MDDFRCVKSEGVMWEREVGWRWESPLPRGVEGAGMWRVDLWLCLDLEGRGCLAVEVEVEDEEVAMMVEPGMRLVSGRYLGMADSLIAEDSNLMFEEFLG